MADPERGAEAPAVFLFRSLLTTNAVTAPADAALARTTPRDARHAGHMGLFSSCRRCARRSAADAER
ncbi:hypothetical protein BE21_32885 [Sorangium cellulosum]|uniref:Uncharacterized protein n=1 Tax=Sorangium cellulosum TaxID=56 RepID=A0A150TQM9_SORCE|nr:hypothetical protein BE21_32885 [Sorangium cellulosum]